MHDITYAREIVRVVNARRQSLPRTSRVTGVHIRISPLSHVTVRSLSDAFRQMVGGTDLEHLSLHVEPLPVKMRCDACGAVFEITAPAFTCAQCSSSSISIADDREFSVDSMEIEDS